MEDLVSFSVFSCGALQMTCILSEEQIIPIALQWPEFFVQLYNDMHFVPRNPICARYLQMTCIVSQQ